MSRSQRHKVAIQNASIRGYIYDEGRAAPAVLMSSTPGTPTVGVGPSGGPLQGSSMMGAVPVGWTIPVPKEGEPAVASPQSTSTSLSSAAASTEPPPAPSSRTFPLGPFAITLVHQDAPGTLTFDTDTSQMQPGDTVNVEATGSTPANGSYTVVSVDATGFVVDTAITLAAPIQGKGRVTITGGA